MGNSIASAKNYVAVLDEVYQKASVSTVLDSPNRMVRAGRRGSVREQSSLCKNGSHLIT